MALKKEAMTVIADPQPDPGSQSGHPFRTSPFWRLMPGGMRRRWWRFRPVDLVARYFPVLKKKRGVVVIRMGGLGDMALFRRALDHYAEAFGVDQTDITIIGSDRWGSVCDEIFPNYRVVLINDHKYARRMVYRLRVSLRVRLLGAAICVNDSYFRRALTTDSLAWVSGAPKTISSLPYIGERNRQEYLYYLSQVDDIVDTGQYPAHEVERHYRFLSDVAGREIPPEPPQISWRDRRSSIEKLTPGASYVVLNTETGDSGRRWPLGNYLDLAKKLRVRGLGVVFIGDAGEPLGEIASDGPGVINLTGRTSLPERLDIMKGAALVVSDDSGPAHLSIAIGAPTLVIVGGGHFGSFAPYPEIIRPANARFVFQEMACYHCFWRCHKRASETDVFPCVAAVDVDQAWAQVTDILGPEANS